MDKAQLNLEHMGLSCTDTIKNSSMCHKIERLPIYKQINKRMSECLPRSYTSLLSFASMMSSRDVLFSQHFSFNFTTKLDDVTPSN